MNRQVRGLLSGIVLIVMLVASQVIQDALLPITGSTGYSFIAWGILTLVATVVVPKVIQDRL